jgi:predicted amidohydrolase YtcJ
MRIQPRPPTDSAPPENGCVFHTGGSMAARLTAYLVVAIVAATLIAGLIVGAQRDDSDGPVDLIVRNGTIYTADRRGTMAEAVAIRGNQILRVGSNREIARLQRPQTVVIDARGGAVLPGFNDSHVDLIAGGLRMAMADLTGAASSDETLERIGAWAALNPTAHWVVGAGWSAELFKNGQPTRQLLDAVVADRPALMYGGDETRLVVWVNSRALQLGGIGRKTAEPDGGTIVRDPRTRDITGVLTDSAAAILTSMIPRPTDQQRGSALQAAVAEANKFGITSAQIAGGCAHDSPIYDAARQEGALSVRVYCPGSIERGTAITREEDLIQFDGVRKQYPDDPVLKSGALAIGVDGSIADRTAALLEPYADSTTAGAPWFAPDNLNRIMRLADAAGWQMIAHANGDRAARMALTAYAHAVRSNRPPVRGRRHRIANLALVDVEDIPRFGPLGIIASLQPLGAAATAREMERMAALVGPERARSSYPIHDLAAGTRLLLGSGWPARDLNPLQNIERVITELDVSETTEGVKPKTQAIRLKAAFDAYTSTAAWASFDDQRKGSIAQGMLADLVVLSEDVFAPAAKLSAASVVVTVFDGKIVYQRVPRSETAPAPSLQH